ncbi:MAG: 3-oxoacyl-ACP reductase FabG [Proteobacteria bacterium]|nr:glucose 1-dehydrogenase [Desulfocapsa sp.]MBU4030528.1 3-oxoacyl-ACP reductase FabG [Pseudomonadota bacterium]MBU4044698.1 3-oxoacyl-ACP reductase FabG [Pseudomonadota bacterium]
MLKGKTVIVTGAARGIGAAIATCFAQNGANVLLNSRSASDALRETAAEVDRLGGRSHISVGDVSDSAYVQTMVADALNAFGSVDILVNNAGVIKDRPLLFMKERDWYDVLDTNLSGAFLCTKAAIKPMIKQRWGRVINIASITALAGRSGQTNYGAAKAGLIGFTKSLARESASHNVLVNAAVVGVIDTRMTRQIPRDTLKEISEMVPLGRIGRPEEVANVCLFLASDMSSYVTGTTINVSGGGYI